MANGQNFDPLFAGAQGALNATQRGFTNIQNQAPVPQLPAQQQAFAQSRSLLNTVSQFSPLNVLAQGQLPMPGGDQGGQFQLPFLNGQGFPQPPQPPTPQNLTGSSAGGSGGGGGGTGGGSGGGGSSGRGRGQTR